MRWGLVMNYQPFLNMHVLLTNEGVAFLFYTLFNVFVVCLLLMLTAYQVGRAKRVRSGQC